ncbi:tRNA methyltransferase 2 [Mactra antiquata]
MEEKNDVKNEPLDLKVEHKEHENGSVGLNITIDKEQCDNIGNKEKEKVEPHETEEKTENPDTVTEDENKTESTETLIEDGDKTKSSETVAEDGDKTVEPDEYLYTKRDEFTSEIFKIQIQNLPKRFGFAELKKKFIQLEMKPVKMKVWKDICFVTYRCEEDRTDALKKINGLKWRGCELTATPARPAADPLMRKRKQEEGGGYDNKKIKHDDDNLSPVERLKNSVTPLWKIPYEEQLKSKEEEMRGFLRRYHRQLEKNCPDLRKWLSDKRKEFGAIPCELQSIKPSPVIDGYRNKCEFTIGPDLEGNSIVGFRYGTYAQGTICVGSPDDINFLPDMMKTAVKRFQSYILSSSYTAYNPETHVGNWRQLTVRISRLAHCMIMIDFHPQNLSQDTVDCEMQKIKEYFTSGDGKDCGVTSCLFRTTTDKMTGSCTEPYKLLFGDNHITESLSDMKFQISPSAFFQVNTSAAEVLYKTVSDWCTVSQDSIVLDVCCGTGTIGLSVAKNVNKVIGIEMCSQAIDDAKINATLNSVTNVTYHCAKAEDVMKDITKSLYGSTNVVAIVDPPRGGLHSSVLVAIRNCRSINKLVYVSCNVNGALNNLIDLVRPTSKRLKGERFYPIKAVPVDLFPYTNHCELVVLFERNQTNGTAGET